MIVLHLTEEHTLLVYTASPSLPTSCFKSLNLNKLLPVLKIVIMKLNPEQLCLRSLPSHELLKTHLH